MSEFTEIVCVVDRSASMGAMKDQAISVFNEFLETQKKQEGKALFTLTMFNTEYELRFSGKDIQDIPALNAETYVPGGMTALLDAVGKTIDEVGERLSKTPDAERPKLVVFVVMTDGQENSSKEYKREKVREMVKRQTDDYSWEFVFLAAGPDAFDESVGMGFAASNVVRYAQTADAHTGSVQALSKNVSSYRSSGGKDKDWQKK